MPNTGLTDLQVAQQACTRVGLDPIPNWIGDEAEKVVLETNFETTVIAAIGEYRYNWAKVETQLEVDASGPLHRYDAALVLPADVLEIVTFWVNDTPVTYSRYNRWIYADTDPDQKNILEYVFRVITGQWPPAFADGIVWRLASILTASIKEDANGARELDAIATDRLSKAQFMDGSGVTSGGFDLRNPLRMRRGGSPLRRR